MRDSMTDLDTLDSLDQVSLLQSPYDLAQYSLRKIRLGLDASNPDTYIASGCQLCIFKPFTG